jgi:hypothetical protein
MVRCWSLNAHFLILYYPHWELLLHFKTRIGITVKLRDPAGARGGVRGAVPRTDGGDQPRARDGERPAQGSFQFEATSLTGSH